MQSAMSPGSCGGGVLLLLVHQSLGMRPQQDIPIHDQQTIHARICISKHCLTYLYCKLEIIHNCAAENKAMSSFPHMSVCVCGEGGVAYLHVGITKHYQGCHAMPLLFLLSDHTPAKNCVF